jgi:hypothetical protein
VTNTGVTITGHTWRAAKFRPIAQGLWAGMDLYRATTAATRGLGFPDRIRRTVPILASQGFSVRIGAMRTENPWLARMDRPHSVVPYDTQWEVEGLFLPASSLVPTG